jgi:hypothetical protein
VEPVRRSPTPVFNATGTRVRDFAISVDKLLPGLLPAEIADMKILSFLFPGFTALDLIGPTTVWGLIPGALFQTVAHSPGPVKVDMGFEIVATHSFDDCWPEPDVLLVPGGGRGAFNALQDDALLAQLAQNRGSPSMRSMA